MTRAWPGMAGHGRAWPGMAGNPAPPFSLREDHGRAWPGMAGHGREWPGMAGNPAPAFSLREDLWPGMAGNGREWPGILRRGFRCVRIYLLFPTPLGPLHGKHDWGLIQYIII